MKTAFKSKPTFIKSCPKRLKINKLRWIIPLILILISAAVLIASRASTDFADWFGFNIYPVFSGIGSRLWGLFPFSAGELFVILFVLGTLTGLVCLIIYVRHRRGQRIRAFINGFSWAVCAASVLFFLVTLNCLAGYNRTPFSEYSGLTLTEYTAEELKGLTMAIIEKANKAVNEVELNGEGRPVKPGDFNRLACESMEKAAEKYEVLKAYYPQPKAVRASSVMSSFNLAGIYFPVTVEANYNNSMPVSSQGFTACHELSHLSGFIREDEANYIAFIACRESDSPYFRYSGYLDALTYALNAYRTVANDDEYYGLTALIDPLILSEYGYRNEYWSPYRKKVTYKVSSTVNDAYLKANNQTDGTKSYGRVVDLMLAEWKANDGKI
ncbi:MAG: DUF3810 domain-containing protein [Ruminococcaceae bacterium]|nr:DUF3810 domain-containing protein [Oscillospiraceae bacterium]MBD5115981.1 DUF3810 domain-containing protein [Oscillospiraceae bacterium]